MENKRVYELLGYSRRRGSGKSGAYDFYEIYASTGCEVPQADKGGDQIAYIYSHNKGVRLPCVDADNFLDCLRSGLKIGSRISFDFDKQNRKLKMNVLDKDEA